MSAHPSLASLLESFFRHRLTKQRNASRATIASYRIGGEQLFFPDAPP